MISRQRLTLISLLALAIVGAHNACTKPLISVSTFSTALARDIDSSAPLQQNKTLPIESPIFFNTQNRMICTAGSFPARTLRFEEATQKWTITTTQKNGLGHCTQLRQSVDNVVLFSASQLAVFQNELFFQFIPGKKAINPDKVAAVCKSLASHLDIGQSKFSGLVIYWNKPEKRWQTRLDYQVLTESDQLTNNGPYGAWQKEDSLLIFNSNRLARFSETAQTQRQKVILEISHLAELATANENLRPAILNYTFKVYGNYVQEITDGPMNCWVNESGLESN